MEIVNKRLTELHPYENNPRNNEEAVAYVANSIKEFGFKVPIVIDADNVIIAGHTRYKASKKLGLKEVPCVIADDLTEDQVKAFRLADNKVGEIATWDLELLDIELQEIDLDMTDFGFEIEEDEEELEVEEDEFELEIPEEPKSKYGDIYQLGRHRVMCGDSTNQEDVNRLMNGEIADVILTGPPYNVDYSGKTKDNLKIKNDKMNDDEFLEFLIKAFENGEQNIKPGGAIYIWCIDHKIPLFIKAMQESGFYHSQTLIWVKNHFVLGRLDYHKQHEPCLYGWKEGAGHYFIDDRTQATVIEDKSVDIKKLKKSELLNLIQDIMAPKQSTTVIHEDKPNRSTEHPTMKPVKLLARQIKNSSKFNEIVMDLFGGSGSTLITCEQLNRTCYMMELDPKYVDVIIQRWEEYTGEEAIKL